MIPLLVVLGIIVLLVLIYMAVYNGVVSKRNQAKNAWSQIDVQLKRKANLIPSLTEAVKAYMGHEHNVLLEVTQARAALLGASGPAAAAKADHQLSTSLSTLFTVVNENYPQLQAQNSFQQLMEEVTSTENRVSYARQAYNDAVTAYQNAIDTFPGTLIAGSRFERMEYFNIPEEARAEADQSLVKF